MLKLTPAAAAAISEIRDDAGAPKSYGVRFSAPPDTPPEASLFLDFVDAPASDDKVSEESGLLTFVSPEVETLVGDAIIDLESDGEQASLVIRRQAPGGGFTA